MASFGLRSAVQPLLRSLSGGWPGSLQAGFAQPSQAAQGARRAPGATCCISADKCFSWCASWGEAGGGGGKREPSFLFAARVRRAGFPGTDSPRRVDSPAAGGSPSKSCSGRGLAAARPGGSAPAARASSLWARDGEHCLLGTAGGGAGVRRLRPEGTPVGEWRANRTEIRSSHTLPPGDAGEERGDGGGRTDPGRGRRKR